MKIFRLIFLAVLAVAALLIMREMAGCKPRRDHGVGGTNRTKELDSLSASVPGDHRGDTSYWQARHETGSLEEYSWWKAEPVLTGIMKVVPDPTGSGRGNVLSGEITSAAIPVNDSHRLYPVLLLPVCYRGPYESSFNVWADLPLVKEHGWFSFATYTNRKDWMDLFGVNLGEEKGENRLILFHVPVVGKGDFVRISQVPFPLRQWVKIDVKVDRSGIMLLQDDRLVAEAQKEWGSDGPGLCEAHWGMYAQGKNTKGVILNDDISVKLAEPFDKPPLKIRNDRLGMK